VLPSRERSTPDPNTLFMRRDSRRLSTSQTDARVSALVGARRAHTVPLHLARAAGAGARTSAPSELAQYENAHLIERCTPEFPQTHAANSRSTLRWRLQL
jgi:hypothetical protein